MTGPKSFEGGMEQSRQEQLDKKKELEKKEGLEKSSDKIKAGKEAGNRLDELAKTQVSLEEKLREIRQKGTEMGESAKLPTPSEKYDYREGLHHLPKEILEHSAIDMAGEALLELEMTGLVKIVMDSGQKLLEAIGEVHDKNIQEAKARGLRYGITELKWDQRSINNPHIQEGKPYTKSELYDRIRQQRIQFGGLDYEMTFLQVEASDARKEFENSIDTLVNTINPLLNQAKTPSERQLILKTFVDSASKRISDLHK